jgi:hypothetical protein
MIGREPSRRRSILKAARKISRGPGMSFRCARVRAESWSAAVKPRPLSTSLALRAGIPLA